MWLELGLGIGIPVTGLAIAIGKYFWKKEKCFTEMKNKIEELSKSDGHSSETHGDFNSRLKLLEDDSIEIKVYLRQIFTKLEIPYK